MATYTSAYTGAQIDALLALAGTALQEGTTLPAGTVYTDTTLAGAITAGLAGTSDTETFFATGDDVDYIGLYLNNAGTESEYASARMPKWSDAVSRQFLFSALSSQYQYDLATDATQPMFVNPYPLVRSSVTPSSFDVATIASRDSDTQFTVASGHGDRFIYNSAFVVRDDDTGRFHAYTCFSVSGDVVTLYPDQVLPATISEAQTMHDGTNQQHLSAFGYYAYADYIADMLARYAYKKNEPIFAYNPALHKSLSYNTYDVMSYDGSETFISITRLGNAQGGGVVPGTSSLSRVCANSGSDQNISGLYPAFYASRSYIVREATAGSGISFTVPTYGFKGFLEVPLAATRYYHSAESLYTTGRARLVVLADGVSIHDEVYEQGRLHVAHIDYPACSELEVQFTLADNEISQINLFGTYVYAKSDDSLAVSPWVDDTNIVMLGDSWFEYPLVGDGETAPLRADGSTAGGMQGITTRLRDRFEDDGIRATVQNMARSGQTSVWARYWLKEIVTMSPKPTHCLLHFAINDLNSSGNAPSQTPSQYDFDPDDMWASLQSDAGGIFGSIPTSEWITNMTYICNTLVRNGIQPVVLMPPITASEAQTQSIQRTMLNRVCAGFDPIYAESGR